MNLLELLRRQAERCPDLPALVDRRGRDRRTLTVTELDRASSRAAALLRQASLRPGDGVLLLVPMSIELYIALLAILRLGLVALVPDPSAGLTGLDRACAAWPPRAFIGGARAHALRLVSPPLRAIPIPIAIGWSIPGAIRWNPAGGGAEELPIYDCLPEAPALVTFTSGSTGAPKAIVRSHGLLLAQLGAVQSCLEPAPGERELTTLPMFVLANLGSSATSLLPAVSLRRPGAADPAPLAAQIASEQPSRLLATPALLERLADHCLERGMRWTSVRGIVCGGAPILPRLIEKLHRVAPAAEVSLVYGSSEAEPIARLRTADLSAEDWSAIRGGRGLPAGGAVPGIQVRILEDRWGTPIGAQSRAAFEAASLPPGRAGEIVVSGPHVVPGYLRGIGDRESKIAVEGAIWHRTGDAGYLDARGRLWLLGRCAARIRDARGTLYPLGVEAVAGECPGIRRAALLELNARRILVIEATRRIDPGNLADLRRRLSWAHLDEIRAVRQMPVDHRHNAKVAYQTLAQALARRS
jgi:acyl-CoA synthetase (AMP-forming)/AMP-acid ligase II